VIWAGGGVQRSGACSELQALAEALDAPVFTTTNGKGGLPDGHPLHMGTFIQASQFRTILDQAEVMLAVGTRFQGGATREYRMVLPGKLIHLDADPGVVGRIYTPEVALIGDAKLGLQALADQLRAGVASVVGDPEFSSAMRTAYSGALHSARERIGPDHRGIMDAMVEFSPADTIFVRDATMPAYQWGNPTLPIRAPRSSMHSTSAAIGPGFPLAIGAAVSGRPTVCIHGDGGFMLHLSELATVAQFQPHLVICVFNDRGYDVLRRIQTRTFEGRMTGVELATPDFVATAKAFGLQAHLVKSLAQFREHFAHAIASKGPTLLEVDATALHPLAPPPAPAPAPAR
jgi:acetolactate synthase-1/2/3 large subunit